MNLRSLTDYLPHFLSRTGETAYVQPHGYRTERWSYQQVAGAAFGFARELEDRDIGEGDRVILWGPNSAEWVAVFWGCVLRGAIVVPLDDIAMPDFFRRVHQQVEAKLLVASRHHQHQAIPTLILEDLSEVLAARLSSPYPSVDLSSSDTVEIVFTSGTTAEPKGVVISHGNALANLAPLEAEIRHYLKYERFVHPVRFLNLLPLSHVFGQFLGMFIPPLLGGTVVFQETLKPSDVIRTIQRERVSVLVAVPRVLQSLKEKIERDLHDDHRFERFRTAFCDSKNKHFLLRWWIFRRIRRQFGWKFWAFISGGAALDGTTEEFWDRLGYAVIQGYGLTETTSLISVNHPFRLGKGSIGKVLKGREVKLAEDGEILVRGGGVATGYWDGTAPQSISDAEGWYRTGDIGELDAAGNLYFKGRKKEVIISPSGMNIYPEDLEAALRRQPEVKDALVVGLPRDGNAEPCAVLILKPEESHPEAVVEAANESLADYQRMHAWFVWPDDDFPRTSTQKPRRNLVQEIVRAQRSGQQASSNSLAKLISHITRRTSGELTAEVDLDSDLHLSSLDRVELLSALEDRYQVDLSETRFAALRTVADLQRMLRSEIAPHTRFHYPRWVLRWPVTWIRLLVHSLVLRPAVFLLGWPHVEGRENLHGVRGPVLVVCNHIGDVDPGLVLTALPARLRHKLAVATGGEALEALRTPPLSHTFVSRAYDRVKWVLGVSLLNLFPLPREAGFRDSFAYAGECVDGGYSILVFPEGRQTADGKLRPFRSGVGLLANNLSIPTIPVRIDGLFEVKQLGRKFAWPGEVRVKLGAPVQFPTATDPEEIARKLQKIVEAL
ncbi:MAG: AMP-binding protein [Terriglobales bacterium]